MTTTPTDRPPTPTVPPRRSTLVLTVGLHLLALWPYLLSGLVAPFEGVLAMLAVWVLMGVAAVAVHRRWGAVAALVPLVTVGLWVGMLTLGGAVLGWTA